MILITGANGYIGRNLVLDQPTIGIDKEMEITRINRTYTGKIEGIIHLAAISRVKHCEINPVGAVDTNVTGVTSVLELARRNKAWVIFASSLEAEHKRNIYGLTKSFGEELCNYYATKYGLHIIVIRLGDVIGADNHRLKAIPSIEYKVKKGEDVILTNSEQMFHLIHLDSVSMTLREIVNKMKQIHKSKSKVVIKE